jgi:hypothetical protein
MHRLVEVFDFSKPYSVDRKTHHDLKKIFQTEAAFSVCSDDMAFPAQNDLKF